MIDSIEDKVRFVVSMGVQVRRAMGKDDATIRREVVAVAAKAAKDDADDAYDEELVVSLARRFAEEMTAA